MATKAETAKHRADVLYPPDPDELKTVEEVAKAVRSTPGTILSYIAKGILPAIDMHVPGQRGRPRKMIRRGDIHRIAFKPRWENRRPKVTTPSGARLTEPNISDAPSDQITESN